MAFSGVWLTESLLGGSSEGQESPGRLDILQGGSLKGTGAGCPHVMKDKPVGKKTSLSEQGALAGTQDKKESLCPLEDVAGHSGGQGCNEVIQGES